MTRLYSNASRELLPMLTGISLDTFNDARAAQIENRTRIIVTALNYGVNEWAEMYLKEAYRIGAGKSRTALEILGKRPRGMLMNTERLLIDNTVELVVQRNNTIQRSVGGFLSVVALASRGLKSAQIQEWSYGEEAVSAQEMDMIVSQALAKDKSRAWLAKQLADYLREMIATGDLIEINGHMWKLNAYSKLVARTTLRSAQSQATQDLCRQYDNDLVEISDHGTDCEECEEYEGNVYSISGNTPGFDMLDQWPPFHPNCKHSAIPTSEEAIAARRRWH